MNILSIIFIVTGTILLGIHILETFNSRTFKENSARFFLYLFIIFLGITGYVIIEKNEIETNTYHSNEVIYIDISENIDDSGLITTIKQKQTNCVTTYVKNNPYAIFDRVVTKRTVRNKTCKEYLAKKNE